MLLLDGTQQIASDIKFAPQTANSLTQPIHPTTPVLCSHPKCQIPTKQCKCDKLYILYVDGDDGVIKPKVQMKQTISLGGRLPCIIAQSTVAINALVILISIRLRWIRRCLTARILIGQISGIRTGTTYFHH